MKQNTEQITLFIKQMPHLTRSPVIDHTMDFCISKIMKLFFHELFAHFPQTGFQLSTVNKELIFCFFYQIYCHKTSLTAALKVITKCFFMFFRLADDGY